MHKSNAIPILIIFIVILTIIVFSKGVNNAMITAAIIANIFVIYKHMEDTVPDPPWNIFKRNLYCDDDSNVNLLADHYDSDEEYATPTEENDTSDNDTAYSDTDTAPEDDPNIYEDYAYSQNVGGYEERLARIDHAIAERAKVKTLDDRIADLALMRDRERQSLVGYASKDNSFYKYQFADEGDMEEKKVWWE